MREYVSAKLAADGYSGICGGDCGCELSDLWPCDGPGYDCVPGYQHECVQCPRHEEDNCPVGDGGEGYCVSASKDWPLVDISEYREMVATHELSSCASGQDDVK